MVISGQWLNIWISPFNKFRSPHPPQTNVNYKFWLDTFMFSGVIKAFIALFFSYTTAVSNLVLISEKIGSFDWIVYHNIALQRDGKPTQLVGQESQSKNRKHGTREERKIYSALTGIYRNNFGFFKKRYISVKTWNNQNSA